MSTACLGSDVFISMRDFHVLVRIITYTPCWHDIYQVFSISGWPINKLDRDFPASYKTKFPD